RAPPPGRPPFRFRPPGSRRSCTSGSCGLSSPAPVRFRRTKLQRNKAAENAPDRNGPLRRTQGRTMPTLSDLDDLDFFAAVARAPSLTAAAREWGVSLAAVSRRLTRLEDRLATQLVQIGRAHV